MLDNTRNEYPLGPHVEILEDKSDLLKFEDVIKPQYNKKFAVNKETSPNYGYTDSSFWARFSVNNKTNRIRELYLDVDYPLLDFIELYSIHGNTIEKRRAGDHYIFNQREVDYRNFIFKLNIYPGIESYYLNIKSSSAMTFPLFLLSPVKFSGNIIKEYILFGLYYGILLALQRNIFFIDKKTHPL